MAETIQLTAAHWIYAVFVIGIFVALALRKDTSIVALIGMFILGWILLGSPIGGLQGIFNGMSAQAQFCWTLCSSSPSSYLWPKDWKSQGRCT